MSQEVQRLGRIYTGLILVCSAVVLCIVGCRESARTDESKLATVEKQGGIYRKPLRNEPRSLDPALARSTYATAVMNQLFDGLVQFDENLNIIPNLAESWKATHNGVVWEFKLREGVSFHNGREVTAEDVVYSFTRLMDPHLKSPSAWLFERVKGVEAFRAGTVNHIEGLVAEDKYTVEITLSQPYAPFIRMLGIVHARVVPKEEIVRLGDDFRRHPIGTGPFRFVRWVPGQEIVLHANESYFEGRPFLDELQYRIFSGSNREAILAEFEDGKLEDAPVPVADRQRLLDNTKYRLFRKPLLATLFLWLDMRGEGPLRHLSVRQAINVAINREKINAKIRQNRLVQARGILPPGIPGYNPELPDYDYNPERARQLLAEAGYPEGKGLPPLQLWSSVKSPTAIEENKAIKADLERIGMTIELRNAKSWSHFRKILGKTPNAMYRYAWYADFPDPDNFLFMLFNSKSNRNYGDYHNLQVDLLLSQAQSENNYLRRLELYREAETFIIADVPTINLVHNVFEHLFQPYVRGVALSALGERYIPMRKIWLDMTHDDYPKIIQSK